MLEVLILAIFLQESESGCLYEMLQSSQPLWLVHTEVPYPEPGTSIGFQHKTDEASGHHIITDVDHHGALMPGDR